LLRKGFLALAVVALLAGCTGLRPVYGDYGGVQGGLAFSYAEPASRVDQIIIQALRLRLGKSTDPDAPRITISAYPAGRQLNRSNVGRPLNEHEVVVTASYRVESGGAVVASGTRSASAQYARNSQVLADDAAFNNAIERAAREVAETVRLSILSDLAKLSP
jgi:hypothetical protein